MIRPQPINQSPISKQFIILMTEDSCNHGHVALFTPTWTFVLSEIWNLFYLYADDIFSAALHVKSAVCCNKAAQARLHITVWCDEEFTGSKIAFYDWWRIQSSVVSQFPSPLCGFCQMKSFYTCVLVQHISAAVIMSCCMTDLQVWMMKLRHCSQLNSSKTTHSTRLVWANYVELNVNPCMWEENCFL